MAQGKKTDNETLYNIMSSYFETRSYSQTGRDLDVPISTVEKLVKEHIKDEEFVKLWNEKKEEFATKADVIIYQAMDRLTKKLDSEDDIPVNQLTTAIGTLYDKKAMAQNGVVGNITPNVQIVMVDNSKLEGAMYDETN